MFLPEGVRLKIGRAEAHLEEFRRAAAIYLRQHPAELVSGHDSGNKAYFVAASAAVPPGLSLIAGDFLQNLRSAFDCLVWELAAGVHNTPAERKLAFPIRIEAQYFKGARNKELFGVPQTAAALIQRLQPYKTIDPRGPEFHPLRTLDELCNINKHRRLLLVRVAGGVVHGSTARQFGAHSFAVHDLQTQFTPEEVKMDPDLTSYVALAEGQLNGQPAGEMLRLLFDQCCRILTGFVRFF